jgi:lipopolysaccharide transport system ATP-binding protein
MSEIILEADNLSKKYCLDLHRSLHYGFQDILLGLKRGEYASAKSQLRHAEFWALKDVSFQLKRGESIGILGRNGSGKSTLLKILNGTIKPTSGRAEIYGKIQLLALGVGFNPLLTGEENIKIACALNGFSENQVKKKYDQILEFSELAEFINAPVKNYSSGMYARLGFSVAIHVDPQILLVDEALAVGDLPFVAKCLRKIDEFREKGGTMVLVSHSGYTVRRNCSKAIWIDKGHVRMQGDMGDVCSAYEDFISETTASNSSEGQKILHLSKEISSIDVKSQESIENGDDLTINVIVEANCKVEKAGLGITIVDSNSTIVMGIESTTTTHDFTLIKGTSVLSAKIKNIPLVRGTYSIGAVVFSKHYENQLAVLLGARSFQVTFEKNKPTAGIVWVPCEFTVSNS